MIRFVLIFLLAFLTMNAFGGGYYGMAGAEGVPLENLKGSPFTNYFIPSLILFFVVGGSLLTSTILVFRKASFAKKFVFLTVAIIFTWLIVQVSIIGYISWMQPTTAIFASVILLFNFLLPANKELN